MYLVQLIGPFAILGQFMADVAKASGSTTRIQALLQTREEDQQSGSDFDISGQTLKMSHVSFSYEKDKPILHDVSFTAPANSVIAFAGTKWEMSAATVNAYYEPFKNIIVFPAAILQAPFYSLKQSSSQNYGGIGAVIAHEISHAFDNNGSLFDELGNLNNWWTKEDHEYFSKLADKMIKEFDGIPFAGGKVNGKLTVSENIADAGGLSCANEAAKNEEDYNLYDFFINWAKVWRMKATEQYKQLLLNIDVHAPDVGIQLFKGE